MRGFVVGAFGLLLLGSLHCGDDDPATPAAQGGQGGAAGSAAGAGGAGAGQGGSAGAAAGQSGGAGAGAGGGGSAGAAGEAGEAGAGGQAKPADPYELVPLDGERITSDGSQPNFQHVSAEFELTDGPFEQVVVEVSLATTCYPFEKWKDNPPPAGQNYPADCDAFDRNFETIFDEPEGEGGEPGFEAIRAITPFGGPLVVSADITDFANFKPGKHTIHVRIPTWSDGAGKISGSNGGWNVTAKIKATPGAPPRKVLAFQPLFNFSQGASDAAKEPVIKVPEGATSARVEYRATGHGGGMIGSGCSGPAEEFCKRIHTFFVDGVQAQKATLWRTDCDLLCTLKHQDTSKGGFDYCAENPTGAIESVKASRANWCPGSETPPLMIESDALIAPGDHAFSYKISKLFEGGSWRLSGVYYAYGD